MDLVVFLALPFSEVLICVDWWLHCWFLNSGSRSLSAAVRVHGLELLDMLEGNRLFTVSKQG